MSKRYVVKPGVGFMGGNRVYEVIDTQTDTVEYDSVMKTDCLKRAKKLNTQEAAYAGGFNGKRK